MDIGFVKQNLSGSSSKDHGKMAWKNSKRSADPEVNDERDVFDAIIIMHVGRATLNVYTYLQSFVICRLDGKTDVCVLTIGKHSYHTFQIMIKELDIQLNPTSAKPYSVPLGRLSNDMSSIRQIIPEKVPSLKLDFEFLKERKKVTEIQPKSEKPKSEKPKRVQPKREQPKRQERIDKKASKKEKEESEESSEESEESEESEASKKTSKKEEVSMNQLKRKLSIPSNNHHNNHNHNNHNNNVFDMNSFQLLRSIENERHITKLKEIEMLQHDKRESDIYSLCSLNNFNT